MKLLKQGQPPIKIGPKERNQAQLVLHCLSLGHMFYGWTSCSPTLQWIWGTVSLHVGVFSWFCWDRCYLSGPSIKVAFENSVVCILAWSKHPRSTRQAGENTSASRDRSASWPPEIRESTEFRVVQVFLITAALNSSGSLQRLTSGPDWSRRLSWACCNLFGEGKPANQLISQINFCTKLVHP